MSFDGASMKELRDRLGNISQSELAEVINTTLDRNVTSGQISPWERGKRTIPVDVATFCEALLIDARLSGGAAPAPPAAPPEGDALPPDTPPGGPGDPGRPDGASPSPQAPFGHSGLYTKACTELWELIGGGVGMIGGATGNRALIGDGQVIVADKEALGLAWGKLAETNDTFRKMLAGITEGGAWLQVAVVTGTTVSKCYQMNHTPAQLREAGDGYGDGPAGVPAAA